MFGPLRTCLTRSTHRAIVWCLLVSLPLYGLSGALVELLGSKHVHRSDVSLVATAASVIEAPASEPFGALEDFRRLSSGQGHAEQGHGHSHDGYERHHHGQNDDSVVALDGGTSTDEGSSAAAPHLLAMSDALSFTLPPLPPFHWPAALQSPVDPWIADGMERPPKA